MEVIPRNESFPVYTQEGPYAGMYRIDLQAAIYLTPEERKEYKRPGLAVVMLKDHVN